MELLYPLSGLRPLQSNPTLSDLLLIFFSLSNGNPWCLGAAAPFLPWLSSGLVIAPGQPLRCLLQLFLLKPLLFVFGRVVVVFCNL